MSKERHETNGVRRWWWEKAVPALGLPCIGACAFILLVLVLIILAHLTGLLEWAIHWQVEIQHS